LVWSAAARAAAVADAPALRAAREYSLDGSEGGDGDSDSEEDASTVME
jgi:hypothetical protein